MTEQEALDIVRAQGHTVGAPDHGAGIVRIWVHGTNRSVEVKLGRDLIYLAEGKITVDDLELQPARASRG